MKIQVKKLFNGHVSVRDYIVAKCIEKNASLVVEYNTRLMTVPVAVLRLARSKFHGLRFYSQFKYDSTYKLLDFPFISDDMKQEIQRNG